MYKISVRQIALDEDWVSTGSITIDGIKNPVSDNQVANKAYVDSIAAGLDPKESVRFNTLLDLSGSYVAGGTVTGVDTTSSSIFDLQGATGALVGDRILVKDQTDAKQNGIYYVDSEGVSGTLKRAHDHDGSPSNEVSGGNYTFVDTTLTGYVLQGDGNLTLDTDDLVWAVFSRMNAADYHKSTVTDASAVGAGEGAIVADVFGIYTPHLNTHPDVYVNGVKYNLTENTTGDAWFAASGNTTPAIAFSVLDGSEDLIWSVPNSGFEIEADDEIQVSYTI